MVINEVFPNPTVKHVIFELKFPNLFYLEDNIGKFQIKIMKDFPNSELVYRRNVLLADVGPKGDFRPMGEEHGRKIWQFKSSDGSSTLSVATNRLSIESEHYKSYNHEGTEKFRNVINSVVTSFNEIMNLSIFTRIGLRYIDECPVPAMDNEQFKSYYNSTFALERFPLTDCAEIMSRTVTRKGSHNLIYMEALQKDKEKANYVLYLDFDGFSLNISSDDFLAVTDELHALISAEYEKTIKDPVYEYMRRES